MTEAEACAAVPGCEVPTLPADGPTAPIWRVLVSRVDGEVRIETFDEIATPEADGRPLGPSDGSHALVAYSDGGEVLESRLLVFATTEHVESYPFSDLHEEIEHTDVSVVAYLAVDAAVSRVAVLEPDGTVVHEVDAPAPGEAVRTMERRASALTHAAPGTHCAHVLLIEGPEDQAWVPPEFGPVATVTPMQRAVVQAALGRLTPELCAGVGRLAFRPLGRTTGGSVSSWLGDFVSINSELDIEGLGFDDRSLVTPRAQALLQRAVVHEAGHGATWLVEQVRANRWYGSEWSPSQWSEGGRAVDRARLRGGLVSRWQAVHDSFVAQGWAEPYYGSDEALGAMVKALDTDGLVARGVMSAYGNNNVYDDIAEFAMWPTIRAVYEDYGIPVGPRDLRTDHACLAMNAHSTESVPSGLAAVFTKLSFMRDLRWITDDDFEACLGPHTGLPREREGIEVWQGGELQRVFWESPRAGIGSLDGRYVFTMDVSGMASFDETEYPATFSMQIDLAPTTEELDNVSWPRGVYEVNLLSDHVFQLRVPDAPAANFDVTDGFILVAEATNDQIVGSVFVREALRAQAPVPVPQVFDPPLQLRFLLRSE